MKFEFLRNLAGLAEACTVYTSAGATCGGTAALVALACGGGTAIASAAGVAAFFVPTWPLYWYFTSDRAMEATFRRLDRWKQQKFITAEQARELKEDALRWYRRRLFGRAPEPPPPHDHEGSSSPILLPPDQSTVPPAS